MTWNANGPREKAWARWYAHKDRAARKGISFQFSHKDWVAWWETKLGPHWLSLRGRKRGQYVMSRKGDKGPYAAWNVECKLAEENCSDRTTNGTAFGGSNKGQVNGNSKLTEANIIKIFTDLRNGQELAEEFGITRTTVLGIRKRKNWAHITKDIIAPLRHRTRRNKVQPK